MDPSRRKEFLKLIKRNQTVVLVGETGSGKTTQLPQFLLEALEGGMATPETSQGVYESIML